MQPKITCSILCYNYGRFLAGAIDSCLSQTVDPSLFEVLVIDDGSTDDTPEVCAGYGDRIRVSRTENQGFSRSLARGVHEARGEYIAYLDADDWWAPNKLNSIIPALEAGALVVMHPQHEVDERGAKLNRVGSCGNTSSICVHREAAITLLPATSELYCHPLLKAGRGQIIDEPLGYYRIHDKAMTDRSVGGKHTEFFAKTNHVTADRLYELVKEPPFWAESASQVKNLANWYRSEGLVKDFERLTETRTKHKYLKQWLAMTRGLVHARRAFGRREARLTGRALRTYVR